MNGQSAEVKNEAGTCGLDCSCHCGSAGVGKRAKWLISGMVILAACVVTAARISGAKEAAPKAVQGYAIQKEVTAAASTISEKGTQVGKFLLSKDAEDYKGVVAQTGAPAVLAMVKGKGMSVVADKEVTKDALLKAYVGASRPRSACGAGGCGPSGCK